MPIPYIIGWHGSVRDEVSVAFSLSFFSAIAEGLTYRSAYRRARLFCVSNGLALEEDEATPFFLSSPFHLSEEDGTSATGSYGWIGTGEDKLEIPTSKLPAFGGNFAGWGEISDDEETYYFEDEEEEDEEEEEEEMDEKEKKSNETLRHERKRAKRQITPILAPKNVAVKLLAGASEKQALKALGFAIVQRHRDANGDLGNLLEIVQGADPASRQPNAFSNVIDYWKNNEPTSTLLRGFTAWDNAKNDKSKYHNFFHGASETDPRGAILYAAENLVPAKGHAGVLQVQACIEWLKCAYTYRIRDVVKCNNHMCPTTAPCKCEKPSCHQRHIDHLSHAEVIRRLILALEALINSAATAAEGKAAPAPATATAARATASTSEERAAAETTAVSTSSTEAAGGGGGEEEGGRGGEGAAAATISIAAAAPKLPRPLSERNAKQKKDQHSCFRDEYGVYVPYKPDFTYPMDRPIEPFSDEIFGNQRRRAPFFVVFIPIPLGLVRFIVGKGGESIKDMCTRSGAEIKIAGEQAKIQGTKAQIDDARRLLETKIRSLRGGGGGGEGEGGEEKVASERKSSTGGSDSRGGAGGGGGKGKGGGAGAGGGGRGK